MQADVLVCQGLLIFVHTTVCSDILTKIGAIVYAEEAGAIWCVQVEVWVGYPSVAYRLGLYKDQYATLYAGFTDTQQLLQAQ